MPASRRSAVADNSAASTAKNKANAAFKKEDWDEAIKQYSRALMDGAKDYVCIANRSAAYCKNGDYQEAFDDAEHCIRWKPTYNKGHMRKAIALLGMKKFKAAVEAYEDGLEHCPNDETLLRGLEQAKRSYTASTPASKAARKCEASSGAAKSIKKKTQKSATVGGFVEETKKKLELEMAALQAQLDLVNELETMNKDDKIDLLFSLMDKDGGGTVDAKELASALNRRNDGLTFGETIEKAIEMVAEFDEDGDAELDRKEFRGFVQKMVRELDTSVGEFCEFLVYQILFSTQDDLEDRMLDQNKLTSKVKEREKAMDAVDDPRMIALFNLFDSSGDGKIDFKEVACGLYPLTKNTKETVKKTTNLLLMLDQNDKRELDIEGFSRLMLSISTAMGTTYEEIADELTIAFNKGKNKLDPITMTKLTFAEYEYEKARSRAQKNRGKQRAIEGKVEGKQKALDTLAYKRTRYLFDLWDVNGDGTLDFDEIYTGLKTYQAAALKDSGVQMDAKRAAKEMMGLDEDGNHVLDPEEFSAALVSFAEAMEIGLHQLIDFMCVVSALDDEYLL